MKIEITSDWAVEIVVCTNLETLAIDANNPEDLQPAMRAGEEIFEKNLDGWPLVEDDASFVNWNGGKYRRQGYCEGLFAFDFFKREVAEDIEEWEDNGDQAYGDWAWAAAKSVPTILRLGLATILEQCTTAIENSILDRNREHLVHNLEASVVNYNDGDMAAFAWFRELLEEVVNYNNGDMAAPARLRELVVEVVKNNDGDMAAFARLRELLASVVNSNDGDMAAFAWLRELLVEAVKKNDGDMAAFAWLRELLASVVKKNDGELSASFGHYEAPEEC